jgi:hypothetical protein
MRKQKGVRFFLRAKATPMGPKGHIVSSNEMPASGVRKPRQQTQCTEAIAKNGSAAGSEVESIGGILAENAAVLLSQFIASPHALMQI